MTDATDRQLEILEFMRSYQREHGMPPTLREIGDAFSIRSTNGVSDHLTRLERKGFVRHRPNVTRGWLALQPCASEVA